MQQGSGTKGDTRVRADPCKPLQAMYGYSEGCDETHRLARPRELTLGGSPIEMICGDRYTGDTSRPDWFRQTGSA